MLDIYADFAQNEAAVPVIKGLKSEREKFAGALRSYTIEAMMGDKRALQAGTSHNLGENFARAFNIRYSDQQNELRYCWTTSWGLSTRFIGAIVMVHGDDQGLILPPRLAPYQAVIVPIYRNDAQKSTVLEASERIKSGLSEFRIKIDHREGLTPGFKFNDWEMRGVPLRIEIGPKEMESGNVVLSRRDISGREGKRLAPQNGLGEIIRDTLDSIQRALFQRSLRYLEENTHQARDYQEFKEVLDAEGGFLRVHWAGNSEDEDKIKEETKATIRCFPLDREEERGRCFYTGDETDRIAIFARAY
jgi:prolyl-tRNA synthetase